ncbi:MAG: SGNH/GDSL hydrolase family protein [Candidatus Marinimicrobia bacterium]|nr:SGNH/GDSL hydrolase family protein [Candidatus Neomarinimicrobiota bacterium]
MKKFVWAIFLIISTFAGAQEFNPEKVPPMKFYGKDFYRIEGTMISDSLKENSFDRLPLSYQNKVRKSVWELSKNSAGISIRFLSNSTSIKAKWELLTDKKMNHMAETGIKGVDLYAMVGNRWQFVNTGRPTAVKNEALLIENMTPVLREYRLFLPLYDGVSAVEIGIDSLSEIILPPVLRTKPIVFYGTSITQGGCASRPGMAYTNIISRKLDMDCINFGFSGNGRMEAPLVELISEIDAACYVIDCIPNMTVNQIHENTKPLIEIIRKKHPNTPIVFIEQMIYEKAFFDSTVYQLITQKNAALKSEVTKSIESGFANIYYIDNQYPLGNDHEATVDGVHFTDLGFMRFSDYLIDKFNRFGIITSSDK